VCASHVGTDATGLSVHPVQDIIGMRNIIAHEYGRVDLDEIWKTVERDAPRLVLVLEEIVANLPSPR
jgi:uncharacterized protein with HEPN domain